MTTYLKRYYFDDRKLKQRALFELVSAFESGRLIAFTGSMATESYGYGDWKWMVGEFVTKAKELAAKGTGSSHPEYRLAVKALDRVSASADDSQLIDKRVALSVVEEAVAAMDRLDPSFDRTKELEREAASIFAKRDPARASGASTVRALVHQLGIRRFATLNYDLELESEIMVEPHQRSAAGQPAQEIRELICAGVIVTDDDVRHRMTRLLTSGLTIESDVRDRERPDRMIEFGVGSVDVDYRIMHLHGQACEPATMILGLRDYDRLYRKDDLAKLPFEHGQRILFGGNPVLFIGVGMSEPEVNATLQDFVSNNPYRRFAPTFLLWNTTRLDVDDLKRPDEIAVKRIDFLQRLGIFALFDEDLDLGEDLEKRLRSARELAARLKAEGAAAKEDEKEQLRADELALLAGTVARLAETAKAVSTNLKRPITQWRSINRRIARVGAGGKQPIALWGTPQAGFDAEARLPDKGSHFRAIVARTGSGKGSLAWKIAGMHDLPEPFDDIRPDHRLVINAAYAFDTDFLLLAISRFLLRLKGSDEWDTGPPTSRETQFAAADAFSLSGKKALVIINGMERFFTVTGAPLSAELDHMLRIAAKAENSGVRWLFFGSERITRYFETIAEGSTLSFEQCCTLGEPLKARLSKVNSHFLTTLIEAFTSYSGKPADEIFDAASTALVAAHGRGEHQAMRRAVLGGLLDVGALVRVDLKPVEAALAMEIIRAMAFIGAPVEAVVLLHVPRVRKAIEAARRAGARNLTDLLAVLKTLKLVVHIDPFEDYPGDGKELWERFGLHSIITSELRHQFGVPVSESKLSTSFNMSLYVAQPVDGFVPETAIHEELATLIDYLIGAYKDPLDVAEAAAIADLPSAEAKLKAAAAAFTPPLEEKDEPAKLAAMCAPAATAALRAALAVVRGYYSTSSLLTLDRGDRRVSEDRDGVLLEHAERLERLLRTYHKLDRFRSAIAAEIANPEAARRRLGPEAFYPDDLVWIYNELGVVYLAQGDLYGARTAFNQALRVNSMSVEFSDRSHNWRRITMNQVLLDIERAKLGQAERKLAEIEGSINDRKLDRTDSEEACARLDHIRRLHGRSAPPERTCFDKQIMHEELLMAALVLGHRALCEHLRGHLTTAQGLYEDSIAVLQRLGEHRAYAIFQHHFARLKMQTEPGQGSEMQIQLAVTAAESVRQMDAAYHARISNAETLWRGATSDASRRRAVRHLTNALSYAALMDLHRLRVQAWMSLARLKFDGGDYESALEHATEAMALASRYGLSLRKISLRLDIGQILIRRGDPKSGAALLERAAEAADRFGYQRAVEAAQRIRLEEELPG